MSDDVVIAMTWYRKVVVRILLLVATMLEQDPTVKREIVVLAQHIEVWAPKEKAS